LLTSAKEIMFSRLYANTDRHLTGSVYSAEVLTGVVWQCVQWDLVCERAWLVDLVSTVYMLGRLVACLVVSLVSDRCASLTFCQSVI